MTGFSSENIIFVFYRFQSYGQVDPYSTAVFEGFNAAPGERHDYVENHNSNNSGYSQAEDQQRQHLLENNYKSAHLIQMVLFEILMIFFKIKTLEFKFFWL